MRNLMICVVWKILRESEQMKGNEIGGARSTHEKSEILVGSWPENMKLNE
jgi:hypothetical protein